ncbi:K(+)-transporting ATPase subunit C [Nocardioides sp. CFH 31398]|uniref:K(+)-transporting ATPase subunit C n=1 Tax=Nocardioides sp. CFH 31398 TaxID=2919579 RepID=UPI001F058329|nr:K(+)-transporting ATPase subunit C [Nocardioides sp. CFH 31398]MCH1866205.1 K(+)-transporting ATPase subunit C [Nocardioides sp. CFH 31398]
MNVLTDLWRQSLAGLRLLVAATLVLGVVYPAVVLGFGRVAAPWQAEGSLVTADGSRTTDVSEAAGSSLLGQVVDDPDLFWNRPSAAGEGYDTLSTYGSNLGPEEPALLDAVRERQAELAEANGVDVSELPPDAVTASGSGLDPHISVAYAELQVPRVAEATGIDEDTLRGLVEEHTQGRTLGVLGEPRVDVLGLNTAVLQEDGS